MGVETKLDNSSVQTVETDNVKEVIKTGGPLLPHEEGNVHLVLVVYHHGMICLNLLDDTHTHTLD